MHTAPHLLRIFCSGLFCLMVALLAMPLRAGPLEPPLPVAVYAEAFVPLQHLNEQNEPTGYVFQFVQELLVHVQRSLPLQITRPIEFVPLKRALVVGEREANVLLLSVARTPEREDKFLWLTEVSPYQLWLYQAKGNALPPLKTLADLKGKGLRFGVQNGSNFHEWLRAQGVGQAPDNSFIDPAPQNNLNFRKALAGRIDVFAHPDVSFAYRVQLAGLNLADFEAVMPIQPLSVPLWLVLSKDSDPRLVAALRASIKALRASGRFPQPGSSAPK
jgi:polar amino acid transport system substrate-binding protein